MGRTKGIKGIRIKEVIGLRSQRRVSRVSMCRRRGKREGKGREEGQKGMRRGFGQTQ